MKKGSLAKIIKNQQNNDDREKEKKFSDQKEKLIFQN
jgi:hypothetical protein